LLQHVSNISGKLRLQGFSLHIVENRNRTWQAGSSKANSKPRVLESDTVIIQKLPDSLTKDFQTSSQPRRHAGVLVGLAPPNKAPSTPN